MVSYVNFLEHVWLEIRDPMSPYLIMLSMEVFSRLLQSSFEEGNIGFLPKTEEIGISHLMFTDDVMIFFDGSASSLQAIIEVLEHFADWSGLNMNKEKTQLFLWV